MARAKTDPTEPRQPRTIAAGRGGEVVIYEDPERRMRVDVRLEQETVWLTQKQMAQLFQTERSVITKHLRNIFTSGELDKNSVCAFFAHTAEDGKTYRTQFYNLDAIISVGYRVNSKRGTQFRIWTTQVLREHLVRGYTVNARRLAELRQTIRLVSQVAEAQALAGDEAAALLRLVRDYADSLVLLDDYDHGRLAAVAGRTGQAQPLTSDEVQRLIRTLRAELGAGELFGRE
jgi:hypothetical protein